MTTHESLQNDTRHHNIQRNNLQYNATKCNNYITIEKVTIKYIF